MYRRKPTRYELEEGNSVTTTQLRRADQETQLDAMRRWFFANYADPAENTPYDSGEGGYQYIWGGPFDVKEELDSEFGGIVRDGLIDKLVSELSNISWEWTRHPTSADFDDYLFESIAQFTGHRTAFQSSIREIGSLLNSTIDAQHQQCLLRLLYVNVITVLETYLSDFFITSISADHKLLRRFVETNPEFRSEKISVSEIFDASEKIEQRVRSYLLDVVWHHLARIKPMFRDTLGVKFPVQMKDLFRAIVVRHDLVHRNGKKKDGTERVIEREDIEKLIAISEHLVTDIESQWLSICSEQT